MQGHLCGHVHGDSKPVPESDVLVPTEPPTAPKTDYVAMSGAVAQILASAMTIAAAATQF